MNNVQKSLVGAAVLVAGAAGGYSLASQIKSSPAPTASPTVQATATASPTPNLGAFTVSGVKATVKGDSGIIVVSGAVTSTDTKDRSVKLHATFTDKQGKAVGSATGLVDVAAGKTANFQLFTTDYVTDYKDLTVQVDEVR